MGIDKQIDSAVEQVVDARIRQGVLDALGKDPQVIVAAVVDSALQQKGTYGRETIFQAAINEMIRMAATTVFREWLAEQRPYIEQRIKDKLRVDDDGTFAERIADACVRGLTDSFSVTASMAVKDW